MRISKSMAEDVAEKLLKPKKDNVDIVEKDFLEASTVVAEKYLDPEIVKVFIRHCSYFETTKDVLFHSYINETRVELNVRININIPRKNSSYKMHFDIMPKEFEKLKEAKDLHDRLKNEYKSSVEIVSNTIYNLRTPIQIKKHFPEAFELLPKSTNGSMLPMVKLDQVRALVQINTTSNAV